MRAFDIAFALGCLLLPSLLPSRACAQQTQTLPAGFEQAEGTSTDSSLFYSTARQRWNWVYSASHLPQTGPIEITRLELRPDLASRSWNAATHAQLELEIGQSFRPSSSPVYALDLDASWDQGSPRTVHAGSLALPSGSAVAAPRPWLVSFPASYVVDARDGRELILAWRARGALSQAWSHIDAVATSGSLGATLGHPFSATAGEASVIDRQRVPLVRIHYRTPTAIHAAFRGSPTALPGPIAVGQTVALQDLSFTPDPRGITSWEWDFESDGRIDATIPSPSFRPSVCGAYDVTLHVRDATGARATVVRRSFLRVGLGAPLLARFAVSFQRPSGRCPLLYSYLDRSVGAPTQWAWDFEADGIVDSTLPNPTQIVPAPGARRVRLQIWRGCESSTAELAVLDRCHPADECAGVLELSGGAPFRNLDNLGASRSAEGGLCSAPYADTWYTFVSAGFASTAFTVCPTSGPPGFAPRVEVYVGSCTNLVPIACATAGCTAPTEGQFLIYNLQRVFLRVSEPRGLQGTFDLLATQFPSTRGVISRPFPGCGGARLDVQGSPNPGQTLRFQIASSGQPTAIWLGLGIRPTWLCPNPCLLMSTAEIVVTSSSTSFPIPSGGYAYGTRFFAQGAIVGPAGGCIGTSGLPVATTDTLQIDVW